MKKKILHAQRGMMPPSFGRIKSFCGRTFPDQSQFWNIITMEKRGQRCSRCVAAVKKNAKRWTSIRDAKRWTRIPVKMEGKQP